MWGLLVWLFLVGVVLPWVLIGVTTYVAKRKQVMTKEEMKRFVAELKEFELSGNMTSEPLDK